MNTTFRLESVSQVHQFLGLEPPQHPLISLLENTPDSPLTPQIPVMNIRFVSDLYVVTVKQSEECTFKYGRQIYDFQEGSLLFLAPDQAIIPVEESGDLKPEEDSWVLFFHPELIRRFPLGEKMSEYNYFSYDSHEALHVSDQEKRNLTNVVQRIREEYSQNIDSHSHELIVSNLELLFNYCKRYYDRQFVTRTSVNRDVVIQLESFLSNYFKSGRPEQDGLPTVKMCAREMGYSPNYLSDLLRKETGKSTKEHIQHALIDKAKIMLLGSDNTVAEIAYTLGFEYPQHFSKLFKKLTGSSPASYRN